jgi:hypothetical protein
VRYAWNAADLVGQTFGRLTVVARSTNAGRLRRWLCRCECGGTTVALTSNLRKGHTQSCGCLQREAASAASLRHGESRRRRHSPEYKSWRSMVGRCVAKRGFPHRTYVLRGIRVCESWRTSYESFRDQMGPKPTPQHTVDRIDGTRGYDCGRCDDCRARGATLNCRWASTREQGRNRCNNRLIKFGGRTQPLVDWAEETGLKPGTIARRLDSGWPVERALTAPLDPRVLRRRAQGNAA